MCLGCACPGAPAQCVRATFERALPGRVLRSRARTHVLAVAASRSVSASKRYYYFRPGVAMASREVFESHATTRDGRRPNRELRAHAAAASGSARCGSRRAPRRSAPRAAEPLGCSAARASAREPGPQTRARWRRSHPIHFASAVRAGSAGSPALATRLRRRAQTRRIAWPIARRNGSRAPPPHTRRPTRIRRRCCAKQGREGDGESGGVCGVGGGGGGSRPVASTIDRCDGMGRRDAASGGARRPPRPPLAAEPRECRANRRAPQKKKKLGRAAPRCGARACPIPSPSARRTCVRPTQPAAGRTSERFLMRGRSVARGDGTPRGGGGASGVPAPPQRARVRFAPAGVFFVFPW